MTTPITQASSSPSEAPVPYLPVLDAKLLRRLGELAAGLDGAELYLRIPPAAGAEPEIVEDPSLPGVLCALVERNGAGGQSSGQDHRPPFRVEVRLPAAGAEPSASQSASDERVIRLDKTSSGKVRYDAFWWSESSLEKFVLPYYLRLVGTDGISLMEEGFRLGFASGDVLGIAHTPRSDYDTVSATERADALFKGAVVETDGNVSFLGATELVQRFR